ncbi:hypothetical protein [Pseudomonas sp. LB3P14]
MAKTPKKVSLPGDSQTLATMTQGPDSPNSFHRTPGRILVEQGSDASSGPHSLTSSPGKTGRKPSVEVNDMPGSGAPPVETAHSAIAWPSDRYDELTPFGEQTGLFNSPDQRVYAEIGNDGRFMVERNGQGEYYVPLPFAPGIPGPILARVSGQPRWRIDRPGWTQGTRAPGEALPMADSRGQLQAIKPIPAPLAARLPKAGDKDGIRYDKLGRAFVDTQTDGTTHVRKNADGEYQSTDFSERDPSGPLLERIEGTALWRQKLPSASTANKPVPDAVVVDDEPVPGPSKRPRLEEPSVSDLATYESRSVSQTHPQTAYEPYDWLPWGHINKPAAVESVQLGWLHYVTLPRGTLEVGSPRVYFLQNPAFTQTSFDAFERMLRDTPWLQPVATYRTGVDPSQARPGRRLFGKPFSDSARDAFNEFSELTCRAIARKVFELADDSPLATTSGLMKLKLVLDQWQRKPVNAAPALADPLKLLPVTEIVEVSGRKLIPLPPETDGPLQRLDFDPRRFPSAWKHYLADPSDYNLKLLFGALLTRSGYEVFPTGHEHKGPTLVFKRADDSRLYALKLGVTEGDALALNNVSGNELASPSLMSRIGGDAFAALMTANAQNNVIWLLGGIQKTTSSERSVFIIRER